MAGSRIPEGKKRVAITVTTKTWEELQAIAKRAGMPSNWLSHEIDRFLPGLVAVVKQAEKDALERMDMTDKQAMARYMEIMQKSIIEK